MDTVSNMLLCIASVEVHQNEQQSLMNCTGFRQIIPWWNFGLCTLYAPAICELLRTVERTKIDSI